MSRSDVAGNWTNLLFLEHLITRIISNKIATVHMRELTTGQMRHRCAETSARRELRMSEGLKDKILTQPPDVTLNRTQSLLH